MKKIYLFIVIMALAGVGFGQILTFEFSGLAGNEATASSNSNDANLTSSTISRGAGLTASANGGRFNATSWALTSIANAVSGNDYMEFTITPNNGYQFSVSSVYIQLQRSGTGPRGVALRNSIDNYASNLDQAYAIADITTTQNFTFTFSQSNSSSAVTYRIYMWAESTGGSGGIGDGSGNDIVVNGTTSATGVSNPTSFAFDYVTSTKTSLTWTNATNSDGVIIIAKQGGATGVTQSELNTASVNYDDFTNTGNFTASGQDMKDDYGVTSATGNIMVYSGTGTSVTITNLTNQQDYYYTIFNEYGTAGSSNWSSGTADINYIAEVQGTSSFAATAGNTEVDLSWTNYSGDQGIWWDEVLILAKSGSEVNAAPSGNTSYTANASFSSGDQIGTGNYVVYKGIGTSETVTNLTNGTEYYFRTFVKDGSDWTDVDEYESADATPASQFEPTLGDLIITEVSGDGVDGTSDDGFMEIYNNTSNTIILDNVQARYFNSNPASSTQQVSLSGTLASGGFIIITQNETNFNTQYTPVTADFSGTEFYFNGGDDGVDVYHSTNGVIDQFNDNGSGQSPWSWNDDYVYERVSLGSGATESNWYEYTAGIGTPKAILEISWNGSTNTAWSTSGNWDKFVPGTFQNVTVPSVTNYPTISASAKCNNITIGNGASLIGSESLTVNGTATMQRTIDGYARDGNGWHLLSSPVNNMVIASSDFEPGTGTPNLDDFYGWDEPTFFWLNQKVVANNITNFVNGVGYLVSYETLATKDFTGTFNNADVTFTNLSKTTNKGEGWHLLGNPFQSALQWTNTDWVRTNFGVGAKIMNPGGSYTDITVGGTDIIPANQGFFVEATVDNSNTITIPESQRVHSITPFYKNSVPNMLSLKAVDGDFYQKSCIQFMDGSSNNYDEDYDVHFLGGMSGTPQFYSFIEEDNLSTNRIPTPENETIVPMIFSTSGETTVSIEAEGVESFAPSFEILLEDLQENIIIDLLENPIYTFESNPEYDAERFRVHFKSTTGISEGENISSFNIYSFNKNIYVSNPEFQNANVFVYNLIGQEVATFKINGDATNSFQLGVPSGYYLVKVVGDQTINTKKVYLK